MMLYAMASSPYDAAWTSLKVIIMITFEIAALMNMVVLMKDHLLVLLRFLKRYMMINQVFLRNLRSFIVRKIREKK